MKSLVMLKKAHYLICPPDRTNVNDIPQAHTAAGIEYLQLKGMGLMTKMLVIYSINFHEKSIKKYNLTASICEHVDVFYYGAVICKIYTIVLNGHENRDIWLCLI
jgi:hypothetical protein